ncbi:MAG: DUF6522 family protein [Paracoccaceae bacterium]
MKSKVDRRKPAIDPQDLGELLGLDHADVQAKMRTEMIASRFEIGKSENAGRFRLTIIFGDQRVRFSCAWDGDMTSTIPPKQGTM